MLVRCAIIKSRRQGKRQVMPRSIQCARNASVVMSPQRNLLPVAPEHSNQVMWTLMRWGRGELIPEAR
jgi:hypothetical protein